MREIKCKAAIYSEHWDDGPGWVVSQPIAMTEIFCTDVLFEFGSDGEHTHASDLSPDDKIIWLQFTGLSDKNGAPIYEGDILDGETFPRRVVEWNESTCGFNCLEADSINGDDASVVIGNIHQHPHLLEEV